MRFKLEKVHYMPKQLVPNVLYYTEEFRTCAHLCACGCGSKVRTPLGPTEWNLHETKKGPTLYPSIGNWQLPCRSHYWITDGKIKWSNQWSEEEILASRRLEGERREFYYEQKNKLDIGPLKKIWSWLKSFF